MRWVADGPAARGAGVAGLRRPVRGAGGPGAGLCGRHGQEHDGPGRGQAAGRSAAGGVDGPRGPVNGMDGMDRQLRDLLEVAVGEPPRMISIETVRRRVARRRAVEYTSGAAAAAVI